MMHRLRRYDAFASQKWCCSRWSQWCDVCHKMWRSHASLGEAVIIGEANIICRRQTSFKKRTFVGRQKCVFCWWRQRDLNPRPLACEASALTNWDYASAYFYAHYTTPFYPCQSFFILFIKNKIPFHRVPANLQNDKFPLDFQREFFIALIIQRSSF